MSSLIATNTCVPKYHRLPFARLSRPLRVSSLILESNSSRKRKMYLKSVVFTCFTDSRKNLDSNWCCLYKRGGGEEGDVELDEQIMKFMAKSKKPTMFPTRKELISAGRLDLVEAIEKIGGLYLLGWDNDDVKCHGEEAVEIDVDVEEFQRRVGKIKDSSSLGERPGISCCGDYTEAHWNSEDLDFLHLNASTALERSVEMGEKQELGIEGILSRLERQRKNTLGFNLENNGYHAHAGSENLNIVRSEFDGNGRFAPNFNENGIANTSGSNVARKNGPETWRTWSNQRAGFQHTDFEAAEVSFCKDLAENDEGSYHDGISVKTKEYAEDCYNYKQIDHNQIRIRLQKLESELNTALYSLRSKRDENISEEVSGNSSDLQHISDAWEFQENEFLIAKERLRSIRAKLVVLEGKMTLALIDAQKMIKAKQKRIDGARKALQLLKTTCIVWPNSASEVLLTGSFDGWTSQRKMEKSRTGIFSICLKLYPGRYEMKFIVDGTWNVDPLRPIVRNNGYENNLLIVT